MGLLEALADAQRVHGWMTDEELLYLGREAETRHRVVEVGSYMGRSTRMLARTCPGIVWSVDNLKGVRHGGRRLDEMFRENLSAEIKQGKVRVLREPSEEAAKTFEDGTVDMVFIDADHDYPAPLRDLEAWWPKLRKGGLMCGHDYGMKDVFRSLEEFGRPHELAADGIWRIT